MRMVAIALGMLVLAGCAHPSESAADAKDNATCRNFGLFRGSDAYVQCRLELRRERMAGYTQ